MTDKKAITWNSSSGPISKQAMMHFCILNGISVYPVPTKQGKGQKSPDCYIYVNNNGNVRYYDDVYKQNAKMWDRIYEIYEKYYNKLRGNEIF